LNKSKVVGSQLVVARRNPTALLDPVEETLDPVAVAVEIGAEANRIVAIAFRRDFCTCTSPLWASPLIQSAS
jgi:hypothetical protein